MKKLFIIMMVIALGLPVQVFAAPEVLSNKDMDQISAGDWVVIDPNTQAVVDVYHTNNTLEVTDDAQKEIQAISNANAVDSAIAVQTNVSRVKGDQPTVNVAVNGTNEANISNHRPSDSGSEYSFDIFSKSFGLTKKSGERWSESFELGLSKQSSSSSSSASASSKVLTIDETLDILKSFAATGKLRDKSGSDKFAAAGSFVLDYDYDLDLAKSSSESSSSSSSSSKLLNIAKLKEGSSFNKTTIEKTTSESHERSSSYRNSKSMNNHLLVDETAQTNLKVVSNLNAVGSGAAVQTNIASNVGANGSITHINKAIVSSGL